MELAQLGIPLRFQISLPVDQGEVLTTWLVEEASG